MKKLCLLLLPLVLIAGCLPPDPPPKEKSVTYTVSVENQSTQDFLLQITMGSTYNTSYGGTTRLSIEPSHMTIEVAAGASKEFTVHKTYYPYEVQHSSVKPNIFMRDFSSIYFYHASNETFINDYIYPYSAPDDPDRATSRLTSEEPTTRYSPSPPILAYMEEYLDESFNYGLSWEGVYDPSHNFSEKLFVEPSAESTRPFYLQRDPDNEKLGRIIITKAPATPEGGSE